MSGVSQVMEVQACQSHIRDNRESCAFPAEHVPIDFAAFSRETLHGVVAQSLDKIRIGRLRPESITWHESSAHSPSSATTARQ